MSYLYLVMSGILFGGVVFGAKVLYLMGASLFEVLFYPNLISVLLVWGFARRDFVKIFKMPWRITAVYVLSVTAIVFGQAAPLFLDVPVTLVVLLIYLQPVWTILIVRFWFKRRQNAKSWFLVGSMVVGLLLLINPFGGLSFSLPGITLALLAGVGLSVWLVVTNLTPGRVSLRLELCGPNLCIPCCRSCSFILRQRCGERIIRFCGSVLPCPRNCGWRLFFTARLSMCCPISFFLPATRMFPRPQSA